MKKTKLISLIFMSLIAANSFASFDSSTVICNKTKSDFNFKLTYKHNADVYGPDSYQFALPHGVCHTVKFWMSEGYYEADDDLMFTDQTNANNTFHIKAGGDSSSSGINTFDTAQFNMLQFNYNSHSGTVYNDTSGVVNKPSTLDIVDLYPLPSGDYSELCKNVRNDLSSKADHIIIVADCPDLTNHYTPGHYPQIVYTTKTFDYSECKAGAQLTYVQAEAYTQSGSLQGHFSCVDTPSRTNGAAIFPWASKSTL